MSNQGSEALFQYAWNIDRELGQLGVRQEARAMLRAAVDLGDLAGESQARLLLALCLQEAGDYEEDAAHVICLLALGRIIDLGVREPRRSVAEPDAHG